MHWGWPMMCLITWYVWLSITPLSNAHTSNLCQTKATDYSQQWESIAFTRSGEPSSSGLLYNLYAARLLGAEVVRGQVYEIHAELYASQVASGVHPLTSSTWYVGS